MAERKLECSKCGNRLEEGFLMDRSQGGLLPSTWVEGEPEKSFWFGTKVRGKQQHPVQAYRCARCGRIELYAEDSVE